MIYRRWFFCIFNKRKIKLRETVHLMWFKEHKNWTFCQSQFHSLFIAYTCHSYIWYFSHVSTTVCMYADKFHVKILIFYFLQMWNCFFFIFIFSTFASIFSHNKISMHCFYDVWIYGIYFKFMQQAVLLFLHITSLE